MVKPSDIIRDLSEKKSQDKPALQQETVELKEDKETIGQIKHIYEDVIFEVKQRMDDIRKGKIIEGREIIELAKIIVGRLRINNEVLLSLINIFVFYGESKDYLYSHSVNVSILAANLGLALGYGENELIDLCASSLLHDIGLLKISEEIVNKPSTLSKKEYTLIKEHPLYGLELLRNIIKDGPQSAPEVIYEHHEKIDGSGYPKGKIGKEISQYAKITSIAEVYETITHPRPYRKHKIIPYEAVKIIVQEARRSFEPKLVKIFFNFITPYPVGSFVLLNSGEIGRVARINENLPLRPVVEIYYDLEGKLPENSKKVDLTKSSLLYIRRAVDDSRL